ncbi:cadherin-1-like [Astyanax mexicanus]|uniref:Cadherin-1-like n=1 Tax=Astyanax mexicanus TaxID=7994 RepID=A0A8T2KTS0_ASTMX|nr:cadherin-1-like [Astyanax mexicanus]
MICCILLALLQVLATESGLPPFLDHGSLNAEEGTLHLAELYQDVSALEFPESYKGLRRRKREWVIPPIAFPENHRGPFPKEIGQIKSAFKEVIYSITGEGADQPPVGLFTINKNTGYLSVTKALDRETKHKYIQAHAVEADGELKEEPMEMVISVIDVNDNKPNFTQNPFLGSIPESSTIGVEFMTVTATDEDDPETDNAEVRYSIISQDPPQPSPNMFIINSTSGGITVNSDGLDRENYPEYTLLIQAADMMGNGLVTTGTAVITVTVSNDHAPKFEQNSYTVSVPENKVGAVVVKLPVTDGDEPQSPAWMTKFRIISEESEGFFNVSTGPNQQEGIITTAKPLNFEENNKHTLLVVVENDVVGWEPPLVKDLILAVDDNPIPATGTGTLKED